MMQSLRWASFKLTLFTIVTIVVTMWLAATIGNFRFFSTPYTVTAQFEDASGLLRGDVVKAAGVTVGKVSAIEVTDGLAVVSLAIDDDIDLPAGVRAEIRFRNLIGQRMVTMVDDPAGHQGLLSHGETIPLERTESAFDLSALFNGLRPLIRSTSPRDINIVAKSLTAALSGRADEIEGLLHNLALVSETVASRDRALSGLLEDINIVAEDLASRDQQLQRTFSNVDDFLTDVAGSKEDLSAALVSLDEAAGIFRRIVSENEDNITAELEDLATLFDAVNDKRKDLRGAVRALPSMLVAVERVNSYGQWSNLHLIHVCKDDSGTCGARRMVP